MAYADRIGVDRDDGLVAVDFELPLELLQRRVGAHDHNEPKHDPLVSLRYDVVDLELVVVAVERALDLDMGLGTWVRHQCEHEAVRHR